MNAYSFDTIQRYDERIFLLLLLLVEALSVWMLIPNC